MFYIVVLFIICVVNLGLGALVLVRNPRSRASVDFFLISFFVSLWAVANYYAGNLHSSIVVSEWGNRIAYAAAFVAIAFGLRFTQGFLKGVYLGFGKVWDTVFAVLAVVTALGSLTSWVAGDVTLKNGQLSFSIGPLLVVYLVIMCFFVFLIIRTLNKVIRISKGRDKQQALFIMAAFTIPPLGGLITNAILPVVTDSWYTAIIGPMFSIVMVGTIGYSIIKFRLFDIRFAIARFFASILLFFTIVALFVIAALGIAHTLFGIDVGLDDQIFIVIFSIVIAMLFQPLSRFFNKISNRLFYRDAYVAQDVLDQLSTVFVGTVDIHAIREQTLAIFEQTLKPTSVRFLLRTDMRMSAADKTMLKQLLATNKPMILADDLPRATARTLAHALLAQNIAQAVRLHTSDGDLGFMLLGYRRSGASYTTSDQRLLGVVADELALAIQNALRFNEIQNFNLTLQQKIEDATKRLRQTNAKLKALDQIKDDFIGMASHQLRTPLTSMKGYVSMVLDGDAGRLTPLQRKLLNQAFVSSQRMVYLISDLLNVSRLRTGKFVINPVATDLRQTIQGEVEQLRETSSGRNIRLINNEPEHFPMLMLDETKIRQVIMNFMDNAIYYTPSGGEITINLVEKPLSVEFTVTDTGIGVPKHEQHHLFTKFYRADNAKRARPDGTGLGLFMAKKVIVAQGGAIIFHSKERKGSTFGFTFAKAPLLPVGGTAEGLA